MSSTSTVAARNLLALQKVSGCRKVSGRCLDIGRHLPITMMSGLRSSQTSHRVGVSCPSSCLYWLTSQPHSLLPSVPPTRAALRGARQRSRWLRWRPPVVALRGAARPPPGVTVWGRPDGCIGAFSQRSNFWNLLTVQRLEVNHAQI
jgi:hypothetical protein